MLAIARQRLQKDDEDGFTLIELMVVVLIIAILLAIAIPTFLGAQDRARDRGAQSDLRNGITAAKTIATDDAGLFTNVGVTSLQAAEGALLFGATASATTIGVVVDATPAVDTLLLGKPSASGTWFGMGANSAGAIVKCKGATALTTYVACSTAAGTASTTW